MARFGRIIDLTLRGVMFLSPTEYIIRLHFEISAAHFVHLSENLITATRHCNATVGDHHRMS